MRTRSGPSRDALWSGTVASLVSTAALVLAAKAEGKGGLRPTNSTSRWLNGVSAGTFEGADLEHTAVGYATHHAATWFWAVLFEAWRRRRRPATASRVLQGAIVVSALAAAVDYGLTPKRFTPGWEAVLTKHSMTVIYGAMALGLAASVLGARGQERGKRRIV